MKHSRIEELLHRRFDDDLIAGEAAELDLRLAKDRDAQAMFAQLRGVHDGLLALPTETPSPHFAAEVMRRVDAISPDEISNSSRPSKSRWRPSLREVLAFAAGVGFVLVLRVSEVPSPEVDGEQAAGALVTAAARPVDANSLMAGGGEIQAKSFSLEDGARVEISGEPERTTRLEMRFDADSWIIARFEGAKHANLAMEAGVLRFTQESAFRCVVDLQALNPTSTPAPMHIRATDQDEVHDMRLKVTTGARR